MFLFVICKVLNFPSVASTRVTINVAPSSAFWRLYKRLGFAFSVINKTAKLFRAISYVPAGPAMSCSKTHHSIAKTWKSKTNQTREKPTMPNGFFVFRVS